jgi:cardiolipin synthase
VVVEDGLYSLVGGINISNRYNDLPAQPAWLDMALYCEGEASYILYKKCREMWGNKNITPTVSHEMIEKFCKANSEQERTNVRVIRMTG